MALMAFQRHHVYFQRKIPRILSSYPVRQAASSEVYVAWLVSLYFMPRRGVQKPDWASSERKTDDF